MERPEERLITLLLVSSRARKPFTRPSIGPVRPSRHPNLASFSFRVLLRRTCSNNAADEAPIGSRFQQGGIPEDFTAKPRSDRRNQCALGGLLHFNKLGSQLENQGSDTYEFVRTENRNGTAVRIDWNLRPTGRHLSVAV